jgi:membrane associated rhomboid family serine protease
VLIVRLLVAAALLVTGGIHLDLADSYDGIGERIGVGDLFRAQGGVAALVAAWLVLRRRDRLPLLAAALVALASTAAVVLSVYVRLPALGPFPELYEPVWYRDKAVSAAASALAAALALALLSRRQQGKVT